MIFKDQVFLCDKIQTYFPKKYCATKEPIDFLEIFFLRRNQKSMRNNTYPFMVH